MRRKIHVQARNSSPLVLQSLSLPLRSPANAARSATTASETGSGPLASNTSVSERQRYCIVEIPTGSHIQSKVCKTRAEWLADTTSIDRQVSVQGLRLGRKPAPASVIG